MRVAAAPRMRVEISAGSPFWPIWAHIWPKCQFLVIDLNVKKKLPYAWKTPKLVQQGLGMSICTLKAHFYSLDQNPNFAHFRCWTCNPNFHMCRIGANTHPKPFFSWFSVFLNKIEYFSYLDHLWVIKTRWVLLTGKSPHFHLLLTKIPISGLLSQNETGIWQRSDFLWAIRSTTISPKSEFWLKKVPRMFFSSHYNSASFPFSKVIKVWKQFYFFQKSRKFSKKGLWVSICTHMAHLKFPLAGSGVKIMKFSFWVSYLKVCLWGANTHPKPFLGNF